jgi:hypothetical protein
MYFLTTEPIDEQISVLYFTDRDKQRINIPLNTILCDEHQHQVILDPSSQQYVIRNDTNYELNLKQYRMECNEYEEMGLFVASTMITCGIR